MANQDDVNRIIGGFGTIGQGMRGWEDDQRAEAARNRPLSNNEQIMAKWKAKILAGETGPEEGAILAKQEMGHFDQPQQQQMGPTPQQAPQQSYGYQPQQGQSFGLGGQANSPMMQQPAPQPAPQAQPQMQAPMGPPPGMSAPQGQPQVPQASRPAPRGGGLEGLNPRNQGDMAAIDSGLAFVPHKPQVSQADWMAREAFRQLGVKNSNEQKGTIKTGQQDDAQDATSQENAKKQTAQATIEANKIKKDLMVAAMRAKANLAQISAKGSVSEQIKLLELEQKELGRKSREMTETLKALPYIAGDDAASSIVKSGMQEVAAQQKKLQQEIERRKSVAPTQSSSTSTRISTPAVSTPDLLKMTRGQ